MEHACSRVKNSCYELNWYVFYYSGATVYQANKKDINSIFVSAKRYLCLPLLHTSKVFTFFGGWETRLGTLHLSCSLSCKWFEQRTGNHQKTAIENGLEKSQLCLVRPLFRECSCLESLAASLEHVHGCVFRFVFYAKWPTDYATLTVDLYYYSSYCNNVISFARCHCIL
jgi:hypothetical protein